MELNSDNKRCGCCRSFVDTTADEDCPYCGYPIAQAKEQQFLRASIANLECVVANGRAAMTVVQLIACYQQRLNYLSLLSEIKFPVRSAPVAPASAMDIRPISPARPPVVTSVQQSRPSISVAQGGGQVSSTTRRHFSWKTFLSDQTINIVALLGAFLILVGSLSFVITTSNTLLSFLVALIVHAVFGIASAVTHRFPAFRTVSLIYMAIFSLQVPLVGFSAYQNFILRDAVQLDIAVLIAIIAFYATAIYGLLAIYLRFPLFAYLSVVCLAVVDLAICRVARLELYWWPSMLMLLAFPSLAVVYYKPVLAQFFVGSRSFLRKPVRVLMWIDVALCAFSSVLVWLLSLGAGNDYQADMCFSIVGILSLLMVWFGLFAWLAQRPKILPLLPYCLLAYLWALGYALAFDWLGYAVLLTGIAVLYHGLDRFMPILARRFGLVVPHVDVIVLTIVGIVPLLATPALPLQIFIRKYITAIHFDATNNLVLIVLLLLFGLGLTISVQLRHTGWPKVLSPRQAVWCRLLWLSYFQLTWIYTLLLFEIGLEPLWGFLILALVLCALAVIARRFASSVWANVLDGIALCSIAWMLLFSLGQGLDCLIVLFLSLATLAYGIICYQRRPSALFLPAVFLLLACFPLAGNLCVLLILSTLLPLLAGVLYRFLVNRQHSQNNVTISSGLWMRSDIPWCWPLLLGALLYSALFFFRELTEPVSILQNWSGLNIPLSLELTGLAILWYIAAVLARVRSWLLVNVILALMALIISNNDIQVLIWLAPLLALLGVGVSRLSNLGWAAPFYILSLCVALKMVIAYSSQTIVWPLLLFATLIYLFSFAERHQVVSSLLRWSAVPIACWSILVSALLGNLYCSPIVAVTCAAIGMGIGCLRYILPADAQYIKKQQLLAYALPLYVLACFAVVLTGICSSSFDYIILMVFLGSFVALALLVMLLERAPEVLVLVALLATWAIVQAKWPLWGMMSAFSLLCVTLFALQFVWRRISVATCVSCPSLIHQALGIGGQILVVLVIIFSGGLVAGPLAHVGAISLAILALLIIWYGFLQEAANVRHLSFYGAGLLLALVVSWELLACGSTHILLLSLVPTTYFIVVAPFLAYDEKVSNGHGLSQFCSCVGALLAAWAIVQAKWPLWGMMSAFSLFCVMLFALQFVWRRISVATGVSRPSLIHQVLGIGGQILVVLVIIFGGGLVAGPLAHVGAISLAILALLIIWYGFLQEAANVRHLSFYGAGLLLALVVSWELLACGSTHILLLSLVPTTYFIIVAPFLAHDEKVSNGHGLSQFCYSVGTLLLLLPTLWLSFMSDENFMYTLVLTGESLLLFLLGFGLRERIFILSGIALVIISAFRLFFLSTVGIPPFLVLILAGFMLLILASVLLLIRLRIANLWRMSRG